MMGSPDAAIVYHTTSTPHELVARGDDPKAWQQVLLHPDDDNHLPAIAAVHDGRVIGLARLYRYDLHPTRWRLAIRVSPDFRRRGIGTRLFNACIRESELLPGNEIRCSAYADETATLAFARSHGFVPLMTTHFGTLASTDIPDHEASEMPVTIMTLAEKPELRQLVADIHERIYRAQHAWSPVGEISEAFRESIFLDPDELVPEAQFIAWLDGKPVGISSLRAPFSIRQPDLGWIGVIETLPDPVGDVVHDQLLNACLSFARERDADIRFEIDDSDGRTIRACRSLAIDWDLKLHHMMVSLPVSEGAGMLSSHHKASPYWSDIGRSVRDHDVE